MNAMNNPTSIDAINLAAENRAKNAAFYESVERNKKIEEENSSSNSNSRTESNNSSGNSPSSNSSSGNSSTENKQKTRLVTQTESSAAYSYYLSESEACNVIKEIADGHVKLYNAKLISLSTCKCKDVTSEMGPDGYNPRKTKYSCEAVAVYELPQN